MILDEPLQQNPDVKHRDLYSTFLSKQLAADAGFQTIVLTSLRSDEVSTLIDQGTAVTLPDGENFLCLPRPPAALDGEGESEPNEVPSSAPMPEEEVER